MGKKRILLMYISEISGHHSASCALENAFHELSSNVEIMNVNSFLYTNPILEKLINRAYMGVIRRTPEVWGYLYDNPNIVKKTQKLRESIHRYNSQKTRNLLENFKPDAVICTQAFPCGIVADYKKSYGYDVFLGGALTDYAPHSYWLYDNVDMYFVPSREARKRFIFNGISPEKIKLTGIPIDIKFKQVNDRQAIARRLELSPGLPVVLVMGGGQGIGPIKNMVKTLHRLPMELQIIVVAGSNKGLYRYLSRARRVSGKKMLVFGFVNNIHEIMEVSSLIITKPGGITIGEALAKGLPLLIMKPIPGQEQMNTQYLVNNRVAIQINNLKDSEVLLKELLSKPEALKNIQERARQFAMPSSSLDIAGHTLERIM